MRTAAAAMAMTALDLYLRPDVLEAAKQDFADAHPGDVTVPSPS
jgi:hypothetical protein